MTAPSPPPRPPPPPPVQPKVPSENEAPVPVVAISEVDDTKKLEEKEEEAPASSSSASFAATSSNLKAAADLIQTLDLAYAEMTHCAADAARDAEQARRNARTASEIARRYLHRSYPKVHTSFGSPIAPSSEHKERPPRPTERSHLEEGKDGTSSNTGDGRFSPFEMSHGGSAAGYANDPLHELNANGSGNNGSRPPTPNRLDSQRPLSASSPSRNRARNFHTPSSADRIAQSHADDVLTLSMDLERSKNAFKSEQRMHDETKVALSNQKMKAISLEEENKRLRQQLQQIDRERDEKIWNLEHELAKAKLFVEAAEEDAELALNLAKESSKKRDEMEDELERVVEELQALKDQPPPQLQTPRRSVRFAEDSSSTYASRTGDKTKGSATPQNGNIRGQLFRGSDDDDDDDNDVALVHVKPVPSPLVILPSHTSPPQSSRASPKASEDCQNAAKLIQESGRRLELAGHWWRKGHVNPTITKEMEAMTRQYCQSVEFKVDRQQKEIKELESLCGFLEKKLVTGTEEP